MAEWLEGVDVSAGERSVEGRSAVAVAAATRNVAVVEAFVRRKLVRADPRVPLSNLHCMCKVG